MAYDVRWDKYRPWDSLVAANERVLSRHPKDLPWTGNFAYRFREQRYASSDPWGDGDTYYFSTEIELQSFAIKNLTPCGMQIWVPQINRFVDESYRSAWRTRFINLEANKTFALPTIPEAIKSYIARKERQAGIYQAKADTAREMIARISDNPRRLVFP